MPPVPAVLPLVPAVPVPGAGAAVSMLLHDLREIAVVEDGLQVGAVFAVIITAGAEARRCEHE